MQQSAPDQNVGGGRFVEVAERTGDDLKRKIVARGAAYADYDGDGDLDVLLTTNGGPAYLYRNDGGSENPWLRVALEGRKSARDAYGAALALKVGDRILRRTVRASSSYASQSEKAVTFGLGTEGRAEALEVVWPSGLKQTFTNLPVNGTVSLVEGQDTFDARR